MYILDRLTTTTDDALGDPLQDAPRRSARTTPRDDLSALIARGDALVLELQLRLAELRRHYQDGD